MFDTIVDTVRTEAAIQGPRGISLERLWEIVQTTIARNASPLGDKYDNKAPLINLQYKCCFWPILLEDKQLEFYEDLDAVVEDNEEQQSNSDQQTGQQSTETQENSNSLETLTSTKTETETAEKKTSPTKKSKGKGSTQKKKKKTTKKKVVKKPAKKKARKAVGSDDDDYSSDGYEPPSDDEESSNDEEEYELDTSEDDEDEEEEEDVQKKAPQPKKAKDYDPFANVLNTNYSRIDEIEKLSFDKVEEMYGVRLRILATKELQTEQLYIGTPPAARTISANLQIVLTFIMLAGPPGITQATLTKALELDPRSSGHYVKVLEQKGAIKRKPIAHYGIRTNICIHVRYNEEDSESALHESNAYNVNASGVAFTIKRLRARMIDLLSDAKDNVMYSDDILSALGFNPRDRSVKKWYHRSIDDLCAKGIFCKVRGTLTKVKTSRCIKLVDPDQAIKEQDSSPKLTMNQYKIELDDEKKVKGGAGLVLKPRGAEDRPIGGQFYDVSLESQLVTLLEAASTNGATQKEIMYSLSCGEQKGMHKYLDLMASLKETPHLLKYLARRDFEFEGRIRRYRYYSYQAYRKLKNNVDIEVSGPPLYEIANSKLKEVDFRQQSYPPGRFGTVKGNIKGRSEVTLHRTIAASLSSATPSPETSIVAPKASSSMEAVVEVSNSNKQQTAKLAPIFQRQTRATRNTSQTDTTQQTNDESISESSTPTTRKRTHQESAESIEETVNKLPKKRGRPLPKQIAKEAADDIEMSEQSETPPLQPPKRRGRLSKQNQPSSNDLSEAVATSPEVVKVPKKRGRPPKQKETLTNELSEPITISPEVAKVPRKRGRPPKNNSDTTETTTTITTTELSAQPVLDSDETTVARKRTRSTTEEQQLTTSAAPEEVFELPIVNESTDKTNEQQRTSSAAPEEFFEPPVVDESTDNTNEQQRTSSATPEEVFESPVVNESTDNTNKQPSTPQRMKTPPPVPVTPSPRRGNLFDYFSPSSRGSPGPSSPQRQQNIQTRGPYDAPRSPGRLYQQLVEVRVDPTETTTLIDQENNDNDTSNRRESEDSIGDNNTLSLVTAPIITPERAIASSPKHVNTVDLIGKKRKHHISNAANVTRTKFGIKSSRHVRPTNNAYQERRQKAMLALLDDSPIWERNYTLKSAFLNKLRVMFPDEANRPYICLKTVWKTAAELVEDKLAQFHELSFTHINGTTITKQMIFRFDVALDGPELQEYTEYMKEKKTLRSGRPNRLTKFEKLDKKVERLEERLERMEKEYDEFEDKQSIQALRLDDEIKLIKANMAKVTKLEEAMGDKRTTSGNWLTIGLQFGFIYARMFRVKLLHQHLFGLLNQDIDGVDRETRTIKTSTLITWMPLKLYCQTIGIFFPNKELLEYTEDTANLEKFMWELPDSIKLALFSAATKFRLRIRSLTDVLVYLGIAKAKSLKLSHAFSKFKTESSDLPDSYQLLPSVTIRNYRRGDLKVVGEYAMDSPSDLMIFWSDLQYVCTDLYRRNEDPEEEEEEVEPTEYVKELRKILFAPKNWSMNTIIDRELRNQLNSYIDANNKMTPLDDHIKCRKISTELHVPISLIYSYFRKIQAAFDRQLPRDRKLITTRLEDALKPKRRLLRKSTYNVKEDMMGTKRVFQRTTRGSTTRRLLKEFKLEGDDGPDGDNSFATNKMLYLDDVSSIPVINNSEQVEKARLRRVKRTPWTSDEDELLIYCSIIMKHHARVHNLRFFWSPASVVFPRRNLQQLRTRLDKIKIIPTIADYLHTLNRLWPQFYKQGLAESAFEEEDEDPLTYNILGQLAYLIQQLQHVNNNLTPDKPLPATAQEIHEKFRVERTIISTDKDRSNIEDQFHKKVTMLAKNRVLVTRFFTVHRSIDSKLDDSTVGFPDEKNSKRRIIELLKIFFRMVLFTPFELYDPFFAHAVISNHPRELVKCAIDEMRDTGQIAKVKNEPSVRKLPGMAWGISKRYLHTMACSLPENFFLQATEYEKFLVKEVKSMFMPVLVSSGMMGCVLNMLSQKKLDLCMVDEEEQREKFKEPIHKSRMMDASKLDFDVALESISNETDTDIDIDSKQNKDESREVALQSSTLRALTHEQMEMELTGFYNSQTLKLRSIFKIIMEFLENTGEDGATIFEIKNKLLEKYPDITDSEIRQHVHILRNSRPSFIHLVGFESLRYVTTNHLGHWIVKTKGLDTLVPTSAEASKRAQLMREKRKEAIDPRLWIDLNGSVTTKLLDECIQVVFQHVMKRPGILERDVRRLFDTLLTFAEVKDLLDILVKRGAIRKVIMVSTGSMKKTLFAKPCKFTKAIDPDVIDHTAQTSYFPTRDSFHKLTPKNHT
ncbi:hypothetical protein INT45_001940 [Circinella minor]|uniref:B-block binding subunit of TFIIIC domain-containing protein n=1 Tax=Circinella minor TaxID=1195481 RepID=A0A8H7VI56_9FUNG|nr:hypothetical protein INT45_001940 [Circinella minor]